jgi:hypothetical protein
MGPEDHLEKTVRNMSPSENILESTLFSTVISREPKETIFFEN